MVSTNVCFFSLLPSFFSFFFFFEQMNIFGTNPFFCLNAQIKTFTFGVRKVLTNFPNFFFFLYIRFTYIYKFIHKFINYFRQIYDLCIIVIEPFYLFHIFQLINIIYNIHISIHLKIISIKFARMNEWIISRDVWSKRLLKRLKKKKLIP